MTHTVTTRFPHDRLDVYQVRRAASATVRHIAEEANRIHPRDKAARFMVARGEVGEVDAILEMATISGLDRPDRVARLRELADRVGAMLLGLIRREQARV